MGQVNSQHRLLREPGGFEGSGLVREQFPSDDPASVKGPHLCPAPVERNPAAVSAPSFSQDDYDARSGIDDLLRIELVLLPSAPVVARALDNRIAPDHELGGIREVWFAKVPDDVLVQPRSEGLDALESAPNHLHVLL
jgi:hypothetical protein